MQKEKTYLYLGAASLTMLPAWVGGCTGTCGMCSGGCTGFLLAAGAMGVKVIYTKHHSKTGGGVFEKS